MSLGRLVEVVDRKAIEEATTPTKLSYFENTLKIQGCCLVSIAMMLFVCVFAADSSLLSMLGWVGSSAFVAGSILNHLWLIRVISRRRLLLFGVC